MARLTKDQWAEARIKWEADPTLTFEDVAQSLGISRPAVSKMADKVGWVKSGNLQSINRAAHIRADSAEVTGDVTDQVTNEVTNAPAKSPLPASTELSTDLRSKLIQSHRAEWRNHARLFPLEEIKADYRKNGTAGKISAEMLSIRQKGERIAWGMDEGDSDKPVTIANPRSFD